MTTDQWSVKPVTNCTQPETCLMSATSPFHPAKLSSGADPLWTHQTCLRCSGYPATLWNSNRVIFTIVTNRYLQLFTVHVLEAAKGSRVIRLAPTWDFQFNFSTCLLLDTHLLNLDPHTSLQIQKVHYLYFYISYHIWDMASNTPIPLLGTFHVGLCSKLLSTLCTWEMKSFLVLPHVVHKRILPATFVIVWLQFDYLGTPVTYLCLCRMCSPRSD